MFVWDVHKTSYSVTVIIFVMIVFCVLNVGRLARMVRKFAFSVPSAPRCDLWFFEIFMCISSENG